ncbi:MAG TPA: CFI-box-CTERM domain-containing protein [Dehalococcoidales bacterium]
MKKQITESDWRGRRAGRLVGALGLLLVLVLFVGVGPAYADDEFPPQLPHYFAGTVSTSKGLVPEGTVVGAWVEGVKEVETAVTAQSTYEMLVPGEYGDDGKIVSFTVAGVQASQTAPWESGEVSYPFDLTISALPDGNPFPLPFDCFIATAAYGTDTAEEINILREFRDVVLLPSGPGAEFVSLYYQISPPIAGVIWQHDFLRTAVRVGFIDPIVAILDWSHALWSETD